MVKHKHRYAWDLFAHDDFRYLLVEVIFGDKGGEVTESSIYWAVHSQVAHLYGDYGKFF